MNATIVDPLQGDFPEVIDEFLALENGIMKCVAFNRRGTLLAAGCADGRCIIWDFETRVIAKELQDKECGAAITSVCWSKYGHRILMSAADKSLTLWDVLSGERITRILLQHTPLQARLDPGSATPSKCLACPLSSAPMIVDLNTGNSTLLPVTVPELDDGVSAPSRNKLTEGAPPLTPTAACFNKSGDLVYVGNSKGEILIVDHKINQVLTMIPIPGSAVVKNIVFSRSGEYLLTNSNDRTIRIYENLLPVKNGLRALEDLMKSTDEPVGSKCLTLFREFQDSITKMHWKAPCFSGDSEWVISGSASKGEHKIYIWDRLGHLVKILDGPKEALIDLAWHPAHPVIVSVSLGGVAYIWSKEYTENWSAFAPDFKELEENEEYVEREDEFDLNPEVEKIKESDVNEDEEIDIMTMDKNECSDSDISVEELCYLPATPCPDILEDQDKCVGISSKLMDSNNSGSPFFVESGHDQDTNHVSSSPLEEDTGATRLKRKRKPSEKGLELQGTLKKPSKGGKTPSRSTRSKTKFLANQDFDSDDDVSV